MKFNVKGDYKQVYPLKEQG